MKLIAIDDLKSITKDVTLENGVKHRCIDATQIHELPKVELVRCKECKHKESMMWCPINNAMHLVVKHNPDWFCASAEA